MNLDRLAAARITAGSYGFGDAQPHVKATRPGESRCRECRLAVNKAQLEPYGICGDCREWVGLDAPLTERFRPLPPPTNEAT